VLGYCLRRLIVFSNINNIVVTFEDAEVAAAEKTLSVIIV
jgi:hypothetical protein